PSLMKPTTRCFLIVRREDTFYMGALLFDDAAFCRQISNYIACHTGHSLEEIGSLDVSYLL
ncbi:MAG: hypothetical protein ACREQP_10730, partial [Candidatus Binatia bacterium]